MSTPHHPEECKFQAGNQVAEKKLLVAGVAGCLACQPMPLTHVAEGLAQRHDSGQ